MLVKLGAALIIVEIPYLFFHGNVETLQLFIIKFYGEIHFDCHEHYPPITLENCTMEKKRREGNYLGIYNIITCVRHGTIQM